MRVGNQRSPGKHTIEENSTSVRKTNTTDNEATTVLQESSILNKDTPREECRGETVFYNVDLKGGLTANSFKRYHEVTSMESCLGHCCDLGDCDVALIKDGDCFAVHCSTSDLCKVVDGVGKLARVWRRTTGELLALIPKQG